MATAGTAKARQPFVRNARPQEIPESTSRHILFRGTSSIYAKKNNAIAAVRNMENMLSRTLIVLMEKTSEKVRNTTATKIPVRYPSAYFLARKNRITAEMLAAKAEKNRTANAFSPNMKIPEALSQ